MTVEQLLENMSYEEFKEWQAYYEIEPFGEYKKDFRAGIIASSIFNSKRTKQSDKIFSPTDFIPNFDSKAKSKDKRKQTVEEQNKIAKKLRQQLGG
jgi:hypothetical protein